MEVTVTSLTNWELVREVARATQGNFDDITGPVSDNFKKRMLISEHSPLRALMFKVVLKDIPSYVSTHLVRHKIGVEHYVSTSRPDIRATADRHDQRKDDPVTHTMIINAAALIQMARERLCTKAEEQTQMVMRTIVAEMAKVDVTLSMYMQPKCCRLGFCPEYHGCSRYKEYQPKELFGTEYRGTRTMLYSTRHGEKIV